jgi:DNA-binding response OmpR family regulator/cell division septation protein DedD
MAGETILIIDADAAIEQKIMTVLEAKGYLVFTASSQVLNAETLEKLGPSLIYIASVTPGGAGLKTCKTIHGNQSLKQVPIVLLGSSEGSPDLQNPTGDGVVDFLKLPFGSDELIKKTETILGTTSPSHLQKGNGWGVEKTASDPRPTPRASTTENDLQVNEWESIDRALSEKHKRTAVSEPWNDVEEDQEETLKDEPLWPETAGSMEKKRSARHQPAMGASIFRALRRPAIGVAIFVVIVGAGILVYRQFAPTPKVWPVRPATAPSPAPPKPRDARPESQLPPGKITESAPDPASQVSKPQPSAPAAPTSTAPASPTSTSPVPAAPAPTAPAPSAGLPQTPSLPVEPAPQPPAKPFYSVQIGAYKDEANAQDLAKKFLDKGYDVFVQAGVTKDKSPIYRVLVSKSEDKKTARKLAEEIRSKERIQTTLFGD